MGVTAVIKALIIGLPVQWLRNMGHAQRSYQESNILKFVSVI
jgi:hypothetical protein